MIITVDDLKAHLRIENDLEDGVLSAKIDAASSYIEQYIGKELSSFDPVPAAIKEAVRLLAGHYYAHREATLTDGRANPIAYGVVDLIEPFRVWKFA
ncbi:head-tail connector protein [Bosea sp. RCC_152_1]|uniref:head-tail connector protein n=1 Tax=Bosea sp. RCC_152_1 TaxID=3239228 RepID=UPI003525FA87